MDDQIEIPRSFPRSGQVSGKRVVITGASRGLGRLLAHAFSAEGALVALVARSETDLKAVAEELPGSSLVFSGDVTDADFDEAVADGAVAEWGGLDVWISNAGISPIVAGPRDTEPEVWRSVLEVNLTGAFLGARAAARVMGEGGRLIFTGSVLGERPREGLAAYSASKAGLIGLAKALALDLAVVGDHGQRRLARVVRLPTGRRVEEPPRTRVRRSHAHGATSVGLARRSRRGVPVPRLGRSGVHHRYRALSGRRVSPGLSGRRQSTRRIDDSLDEDLRERLRDVTSRQ